MESVEFCIGTQLQASSQASSFSMGRGSCGALGLSHHVTLASPHVSTLFPTLQAPHRAAREQGFLPDSSGVYISRWHHGSPSHRYGLFALHFIAEVNGQKTPDLETFLQVKGGKACSTNT